MPQSNSNDFRQISRQARASAVRLSEDNYKTAVSEATANRDEAIRNAADAKTEAVNSARQMIEQSRKHLDEAHDRIEARLRKQELAEVQRNQERVVVKAEENRVKTIKQAEETTKRLLLEAAEHRRLAIQQADTNEKKALLKARELIKSNRETERARLERKRKKSRETEKKSVDAAADTKKNTVEEGEAGKASNNTKLKSETAKSEQSLQSPLSKPVASQTKPVNVLKFASRTEPAASQQQSLSFGGPPHAVPAPEVKRSGTIKLLISNEEGISENLNEFETGLRNIPGIHLLMVGGTVKEGIQITLKADNDIALSGMLRQFHTVEQATDRPDNILIKLKQVIKA